MSHSEHKKCVAFFFNEIKGYVIDDGEWGCRLDDPKPWDNNTVLRCMHSLKKKDPETFESIIQPLINKRGIEKIDYKVSMIETAIDNVNVKLQSHLKNPSESKTKKDVLKSIHDDLVKSCQDDIGILKSKRQKLEETPL